MNINYLIFTYKSEISTDAVRVRQFFEIIDNRNTKKKYIIITNIVFQE